MASVEQGVSFIFCLVVDVWLVSKLHRNLLSRQVVIHILKDSFLFQCQRQDMVYKIKYRFFFIKCCDLRQSLQCGRQQRSSVICVLLPSFPSWWVRENFFQGRVQPLTLEKNSWYFFGQTSFCQKWHLPRSLRQEYPPWPSWCLVLAPSARKYSSCHTWQCEPLYQLSGKDIAQIALDPPPPSVKRANMEKNCPKPSWQALRGAVKNVPP